MEPLSHQDFLPLVKKISHSSVINSIVSSEDVEQELWIKVLSILPNLKEMKRGEAFKMMKAVLNNRVVDIIRHYKCRPDSSFYADDQSSEDSSPFDFNIQETGAEIFSLFSKIESPDEEMKYKDLKNTIYIWAQGQCQKVKDFIENSISPSQEIWDKWVETVNGSKRYSFRRGIPSKTLGRFLGLTQWDIYGIYHDLQEHLKESGYKIDYKNNIISAA